MIPVIRYLLPVVRGVVGSWFRSLSSQFQLMCRDELLHFGFDWLTASRNTSICEVVACLRLIYIRQNHNIIITRASIKIGRFIERGLDLLVWILLLFLSLICVEVIDH